MLFIYSDGSRLTDSERPVEFIDGHLILYSNANCLGKFIGKLSLSHLFVCATQFLLTFIFSVLLRGCIISSFLFASYFRMEIGRFRRFLFNEMGFSNFVREYANVIHFFLCGSMTIVPENFVQFYIIDFICVLCVRCQVAT